MDIISFLYIFFPPVLNSVTSEMSSVRAELLTYLTHVFLGDSLAAEYLILHLISSVWVDHCTTQKPDFLYSVLNM